MVLTFSADSYGYQEGHPAKTSTLNSGVGQAGTELNLKAT